MASDIATPMAILALRKSCGGIGDVEGFEVDELVVGRSPVVAVLGIEGCKVEKLVIRLDPVIPSTGIRACKVDELVAEDDLVVASVDVKIACKFAELMAEEDPVVAGIGVEIACNFAKLVTLVVASIASIGVDVKSCEVDEVVRLEISLDVVGVDLEACEGDEVVRLGIPVNSVWVRPRACKVAELVRLVGLFTTISPKSSRVDELLTLAGPVVADDNSDFCEIEKVVRLMISVDAVGVDLETRKVAEVARLGGLVVIGAGVEISLCRIDEFGTVKGNSDVDVGAHRFDELTTLEVSVVDVSPEFTELGVDSRIDVAAADCKIVSRDPQAIVENATSFIGATDLNLHISPVPFTSPTISASVPGPQALFPITKPEPNISIVHCWSCDNGFPVVRHVVPVPCASVRPSWKLGFASRFRR